MIYVSAARRGIVKERIEGAPDLLVEVLPSSVRLDRGEKLKLYAESGVTEYWIVDPDARHIEFLINAGGRYEVVVQAGERYESPAVAGVTLEIPTFWHDVETRLAR